MAIKHIRISNLRIIEELELEPSAGISLIWGKNGSGKTTILEAIYLLGRGKSFRNAEQEQLTRKGQEQLTIFARTDDGVTSHSLGFSKGKGITQARLDGRRVTRMSDLAKSIPLTIITPSSHEILERGPQYRRRFLDWGVFHVEPEFRTAFERFSRCLKQRNALLRTGGKFDNSWDRELVESGLTINKLREVYYTHLKEKIESLALKLLHLEQLEVDWKRGWPEKSSLENCIKESERGDIQAGYTRYGPHRADLSIRIKGHKIEKIASRGQQKMFVAIMHLAQVEVAKELFGTETLILIDDLTSELDQSNRTILLEHLGRLETQTFITGVEDISQDRTIFSGVFHVEQGAILQS